MSNYEYEDDDDDFTNDSSNDLVNGSLNKAKKRIKAMDSKEKASMEEYISSMYHK